MLHSPAYNDRLSKAVDIVFVYSVNDDWQAVIWKRLRRWRPFGSRRSEDEEKSKRSQQRSQQHGSRARAKRSFKLSFIDHLY